MQAPLPQQRLFLLTDHALLARVVEVNLRQEWEVETRILKAQDTPYLAPADSTPDLIIIGLSGTEGEPLMTLYAVSLLDCVGRVPILIISERPFRPWPLARLWHLTYPFTVTELQQAVRATLPALRLGGSA